MNTEPNPLENYTIEQLDAEILRRIRVGYPKHTKAAGKFSVTTFGSAIVRTNPGAHWVTIDWPSGRHASVAEACELVGYMALATEFALKESERVNVKFIDENPRQQKVEIVHAPAQPVMEAAVS